MRWIRKIYSLLHREQLSSDLDEELQFHLAMREQWNTERGMPPEEARADAKRRFGNATRMKECMQEIDVLTFPETVWQDIRFAARMLTKHPTFTAIAILALGLGIGVNTAIFTIYRAFLLRGIDASNSSQMVNVSRVNHEGKTDPTFSYADFEAYRDHNHVFSGLIAVTGDEVALTGVQNSPGIGRSIGGALASAVGFHMPTLLAGGAEFVTASIVSDNYFSVLGTGAVRGRVFSPDDARDSAAIPRALISENYWQRRFGGDPALIGKTVKLNGVAFSIIGITPRDFMGTNLNVPNFWLPLRAQPLLHPGSDVLHNRENACCRLYGRLQRGIRLSEAQAEMNLLAEHLRALHAPHSDAHMPTTIQLYRGSPFGRDMDTGLDFAVALIMCAVGMVLLIACANLASLQLARSAARQKEMGIRLSLGASRGRLIRQLLTESALLALLSGAVSLVLTWFVLHLIVVEISATLPAEWGSFALHVTPDMQIFGYVFAISLVAGVLFGLAPALESSRPNLTSALKDEGASFAFLPSKPSMRVGLITIQVAVSLVLMISGALLIRSSMRVLNMKTGYETKHVLFLDLYFPDGFGYNREKQVTEIRELNDRISSLPGVSNVTIGRPPDGGGFRTASVTLGDTKPSEQNAQHTFYYTYVQPNYFETLNIPFRLGNGLPGGQQLDSTAVLSESAAKELWPGKNPVGEKLILDGANQFHAEGELTPQGTSYQVVGVVQDTRGVLLDGSDVDKVYLSLPPDRLEDRPLLVRTGGDPRLLIDHISRLVRALDSNMVVYSETLDQKLTESPQFVLSRCSALFAFILGALGLTLASVGIYGTVSYAVVQRTHEMGIRMALGADKQDVVLLVLRDSIRPVLLGLLVGFIGAAGASQLMRALLFGVSTLDAVSFVGVSTIFFLIAILAAYLPARRATLVDPIIALRYE